MTPGGPQRGTLAVSHYAANDPATHREEVRIRG